MGDGPKNVPESFPGYVVREALYRGAKRTVLRATRQRDGLPVIIKSLTQAACSEKNVFALKREYEILKDLAIDGVVRAYAFEARYPPALILEDIGGEALRALIDARKLDLDDFLRIAPQLAQIVGEVHREHLVHRDLTPKNVIFDRATGALRVIDFSISLRTHDGHDARHPNLLEGTLAYIAPEQTGRMNRSSDQRADLYSLGVTFYEMLTGSVPFESSDPLQVIHFHIARIPEPPVVRRVGVPAMLSAVVMRLLAKNPEDRYKSAFGLKADLDVCAKQWQTAGTIEAFALGGHDFSDRFQVSEKLYGRATEIQTLIDAFARVAAGGTELLLVSGYSGIGKSALVNEVHKPIAEQHGHFISGKFDQFQRNVPYSAVVQAFQELVRQLLSETDEQIAALKARIARALGSSGRVITDVIPEVELIVGPQPLLPTLGAAENQNRFNRVFQDFCAVFADAAHPLVLFLDDLQWADVPTLNLVRVMLTNPNIHHFLVVGAFRDNEVDDSHPFRSIIHDIGKQRRVSDIVLHPLGSAAANQLIADTLSQTPDRCASLAKLVEQKTEGNPFFIKMFLRSLHQDRLILFDVEARAWTYSLETIQALGITANVVDLMVRRIQKLPSETRSIISLASSIGSEFALQTLAVISELSSNALREALAPALGHGLVQALDTTDATDPETSARFRFLHDRIQQAAYSLIPEDGRPALHLRVGRLLRDTLTAEALDEQQFAIVDHLNRGLAWISDEGERLALAKLNLSAARKAKRSSAYEPALGYITAGKACLPANAWADIYALSFSFHLEQGELEYLLADWDRAIATFDVAIAHAATDIDRCQVNLYKVILYRAKNELRTSLNIALAALAEIGFALPEPSEAEVREQLTQSYELTERDDDALFALPELDDPIKLMALLLLREAMNGAFFVGSRLLYTISMVMIEITVRHGNSPHAAVAYMYQAAFTLSGLVGDFENARRLGKLALRLNEERYRYKPYEAIVLNNWGGFIAHHVEHVDGARTYLERGYYIALETGMYQWAGYCAINHMYMSFWGPDSLPEIARKIDRTLPWLKRFDQNMAEYFSAIHATRANLADAVADVRVLSAEVWPENERVVETFRAQQDLVGQLVNAICRMSLANWYGDTQTALQYALEGDAYGSTGLGMYIITAFQFHRAIAFATACDAADPSSRVAYEQKIRDIETKFIHWGEHGPDNYLHRLLLIQAELARLRADPLAAMGLYERAIAATRDARFVQDEALANERCAAFWRARGNLMVSAVYLAEAYGAYARWGAHGKLAALSAAHPELVVELAPRTGSRAAAVPVALSTIARRSESLDLTSVLKASHVISGEIVQSRLLEKLMHIALENAGAERGLLLLDADGERSIAAEGRLGETQVTLGAASASVDQLPQTILNYVRRSGAVVVLADAANGSRFESDPYVIENASKSILCMPILHQAKKTGILYLENQLITDAFKPDRIEMMQMLCAQAAISLQNARLYADMDQEVARRKRAEERERALLEVNNAIISNLTRENLFSAIFRALRPVVPFDRCGIFLHDPAAKVLRLIALDSDTPSMFKVGYELAEGPSDWAFRHKKVAVRRNLEEEGSREVDQMLLSEGIHSVCAAPLILREQSFGTVSVLSRSVDQYSEDDGEFLQEVANQVALAIENMRAYEEIAGLKARLEAENIYLQEEIRTEHNFVEIVGNSPALLETLRSVEQSAPTDATVLILGETGTGKELIARAIHDRSPRKARALVKVNCSAIAAGLVESELFGHVKGAFTGAFDRRVGRFELAHQGTLFLDEIGELPLDVQVRLLRVLQEREFEPVGSSRTVSVDVRVIAATNRDLTQAVRAGTFRADLFYRLNVFPLRAPPLRERRSDIPQLVLFFIDRYSKKFGRTVQGVSQTTMDAMMAYAWPGNVRELQNVVERGVILSQGPTLSIDPSQLQGVPEPQAPHPASVPSLSSHEDRSSLEDVERAHIRSVLQQTGGVIEGPKGAALILKLHPNTLRSRMKKLGITVGRSSQVTG